tara:strand:+ start:504 stop:695 length:192 start_codon:yes stop_codon:yes gene_type:complete
LSALLSPYVKLTSLEKWRAQALLILEKVLNMSNKTKNKILENIELLALVSIFVTSIYGVAPLV